MNISKSVLTIVSLISFQAHTFECNVFDQNQKEVLNISYKTGKQYGFGDVLAAISIKESFAGRYIINAYSQDFGSHQVKYTNICHHAKIEPNTFNCNREVQEVVFNTQKSADYAILTLINFYDHYWREQDDNQRLVKAIASYKSGWDWEKGKDYANEVLALSKAIPKCNFYTS